MEQVKIDKNITYGDKINQYYENGENKANKYHVAFAKMEMGDSFYFSKDEQLTVLGAQEQIERLAGVRFTFEPENDGYRIWRTV
jgi:hypothetical protein